MKQICAACFLLLFVIIFPENEASTAIISNATHPDHPGRCYYAGPPVTLINPGETVKHPTECAMLACGKTFSIWYSSCVKLVVREPCWLNPGDSSKPHPYCCHEVIC